MSLGSGTIAFSTTGGGGTTLPANLTLNFSSVESDWIDVGLFSFVVAWIEVNPNATQARVSFRPLFSFDKIESWRPQNVHADATQDYQFDGATKSINIKELDENIVRLRGYTSSTISDPFRICTPVFDVRSIPFFRLQIGFQDGTTAGAVNAWQITDGYFTAG